MSELPCKLCTPEDGGMVATITEVVAFPEILALKGNLPTFQKVYAEKLFRMYFIFDLNIQSTV